MSFFDEIPDDPFAKPANTYLCTITNSQVKVTNGGDKFGWNLNFTINEGEYASSDIFTWIGICPVVGGEPQFNDAATRDLASVKQRLLQFGIPHTHFDSFPSDKAAFVQALVEFLPEVIGTENLAVKWDGKKITNITKVTDAEAGKPSFLGSI